MKFALFAGQSFADRHQGLMLAATIALAFVGPSIVDFIGSLI